MLTQPPAEASLPHENGEIQRPKNLTLYEVGVIQSKFDLFSLNNDHWYSLIHHTILLVLFRQSKKFIFGLYLRWLYLKYNHLEAV